MDALHNCFFGTCSWNYPSWKGSVYSHIQRRSVDYLPEYSRHFRSVEIDSWFYRMPTREQAEAYATAVDDNLRFTCKAPREITLTHHRDSAGRSGQKNTNFLSPELFNTFLETVEPLIPKLGAIILEFEYLNKQKMPSLTALLDHLASFIERVPLTVPIALEPRNANYLTSEYFAFIRERELVHVFSEKQYLPHIYDVFAEHGYPQGRLAIVRLLGGDRKHIEVLTQNNWNKIVEERNDKKTIATCIQQLSESRKVYINVNNHFEGSAPLTIAHLKKLIS